MSKPTNQSEFCSQCGAALSEGLSFCKSCGAANDRSPNPSVEQRDFSNLDSVQINSNEESREGLGRSARVILALAIMALVAGALAWWISTMDLDTPPEHAEFPTSEELFPVEPTGVDSINNTINGKKVAIEGDGHIMNSPGLGVSRPVWALLGPKESAFTIRVGEAKTKGTLTPGFQVLIPELVQIENENAEVLIHVSLIASDGNKEAKEYRLKKENRWQQLPGHFVYDPAKGPYHLRFETSAFKGAIYIDRSKPATPDK